MGRTLSPDASRENAAFLDHLANTGNARQAARACRLPRSRFTRRRARDPDFALRWDAALALAQAALSTNDAAAKPSARTPVILRRPDGTVQIRRRLPTAIAPADEARFLSALAATANVRLSARAAGFASASFYARKRRNPAFAAEWTRALGLGYDRLELALLEGGLADADAHDRAAWSRNDPPPIPPMTAAQALQLLHLHLKEARAIADPEPLRRRRGESDDARNVRLRLMREAWDAIERAKFDAMQSARRARGEGSYWSEDPADTDTDPDHAEPTDTPILPDLSQVTGWSRADPAKRPHDETRAMFGGWRIGDWKKGEG